MLAYGLIELTLIAQRIALGVLLFFAVSVLIFDRTYILPSDFTINPRPAATSERLPTPNVSQQCLPASLF
ncbi:hypothetical protein [Mesorhizobium sp. L103C131B0]|uniref:hypothetical protein n=1 Tax=Mesorhizobium sp. L103C131B0 TaxID=1287089 RepID=UPI0012DCEA45|nr:hypothetical protein [Mesorhizobium sp. L103C131B0]